MTKLETGNVVLQGYISVSSDRIEAVKAALPEHIALTRAEAGCITFEVVQSETIQGRFIVSEVFVDQASFDVHQVRAKNSSWFKVTQGIPREYTITTCGQ